MDTFSINQIIHSICGEIEPYGDTNIDKERFENIENYYEALFFIVSKLKKSAKLKDRQEISIIKIAEKCEDILNELKEELLEEE